MNNQNKEQNCKKTYNHKFRLAHLLPPPHNEAGALIKKPDQRKR